MDQEEYWRLYDLVRGDIETAIGCTSTYLTINRLARESTAIYERYNKHPAFWKAIAYGLQTGFFMAFGRIFDRANGSFSIEDLVDQTIEHPGFFSKIELRRRKRELSGVRGNSPDPEWLDEFIANAGEPSRSDLGPLRVGLRPHIQKFTDVYSPIRNQYFAHRSKSTEEVIAELFSKTNVAEAAEILKSIYDLVCGIRNMAWNGSLPPKWDRGNYDRLFSEYEKAADDFVAQLVVSQASV